MSDRDRNGIDHANTDRGAMDRAADALNNRDDPNRGPLDRAANALDGHDDPNRGPVDRSENALNGHDDPNRGPLDRAANAITGHSGGVSAAMSDASSALSGHNDPNRVPVDRAQNALGGHDDPNRGPLDRAANAVTGHSGGVAAATGGTSAGLAGYDDPNRGPLDRAANAVSGHGGGTGAAIGGATAAAFGSDETSTVSAMFDSQAEAERAVAELRQQGVSDGALSVIAQNKGTMTTRGGDGEVTDEEHSNILRGILGGGAAGAGLGVLALAIPGVGPLAALGAIAASAVPEAMAIGALAGAAAGTFNETLLKHGIDEEDASYYGDRLKGGGVLVTAHASGDAQRIRDTLHRHGGHSASHAPTSAI